MRPVTRSCSRNRIPRCSIASSSSEIISRIILATFPTGKFPFNIFVQSYSDLCTFQPSHRSSWYLRRFLGDQLEYGWGLGVRPAPRGYRWLGASIRFGILLSLVFAAQCSSVRFLYWCEVVDYLYICPLNLNRHCSIVSYLAPHLASFFLLLKFLTCMVT